MGNHDDGGRIGQAVFDTGKEVLGGWFPALEATDERQTAASHLCGAVWRIPGVVAAEVRQPAHHGEVGHRPDEVLGVPARLSLADCLGVWAAGLVGVAGIAVARWKPAAPWWLVALPLVWLVWQFIAGARSVDPELTRLTLKHFAACVLCFYLGYFSLSRVRRRLAVLAGFAGRLPAGAGRRLGAAVRRPEGVAPLLLPVCLSPHEGSPAGVSQEDLQQPHLRRRSFTPTPWPGRLLLLLPATLAALWQLRALLTAGRAVVPDRAGGSRRAGLPLLVRARRAAGCLMLLVGLVALLRLPFSRRLKVALVTGFCWSGWPASSGVRRLLPEGRNQRQRPVRLLAGGGPDGQRQPGLRHGAGDFCHRLSEDQTA